MDSKEAPPGIQFIAGVEVGSFAWRAFRMGGATVFAWQEGAALVLCRLAANEEREAQQAIERGGGAQVGAVCRRAERIRKAIGEEG